MTDYIFGYTKEVLQDFVDFLKIYEGNLNGKWATEIIMLARVLTPDRYIPKYMSDDDFDFLIETF